MIYIACPYWHWCFIIRWYRVFRSVLFTRKFTKRGVVVYNPLVHSFFLKGTEKYFLRSGRVVLKKCEEVIVLQIGGWKESKGVSEEVKLAHLLRIPVSYSEAGEF